MDEQINETVETENYEIYEPETLEDEGDSGIIGKVIVAGVMTAVGCGIGYAISRKDDIKAALDARKEARRQARIQKHLDELVKLGYSPVIEPKTEK